jgi:hypothetical protein
MATKRRLSPTLEWTGGLLALPGHITGEGTPFRPEALLWLDEQELVLESTLGRPGEVLDQACASLAAAIESAGRAPQRLRVAHAELAARLRAGYPRIEVICAATPEVDAAFEALCEAMTEPADAHQSYLSDDVGPDAMASLFRAAAALYRAEPWATVPDDQALIAFSIPQLDVHDAVVSVIGQMGQSFGLVWFADTADFEAYAAANPALQRGERPPLPEHLALNFEPSDELTPELCNEVAEHQWEIAGDDAYPWLIAIEPDLVARSPSAAEVAEAEALARALTIALAEPAPLLNAWRGGEPVTRALRVPTSAGELEITLRVPHHESRKSTAALLEALRSLEQERNGDGYLDLDRLAPLQDDLMALLATAPEAEDIDIGFCRLVLDLAADYGNATVASLRPRTLDELLFETIPRKVSIGPSAAGEIIAATRGLLRFLGREFGLVNAGACLAVLDDDAVPRLEAYLSDRSMFGMAKSMFMGGGATGHGVGAPRGPAESIYALERPSPSPPTPTRADAAAARAKKAAREAERKARKRNRSR